GLMGYYGLKKRLLEVTEGGLKALGWCQYIPRTPPTFSIPGQPNEFIGIIQNIAGSTGYGSFILYLIDTKIGAVGVKRLNWGENEWNTTIRFKE
ncbi:MAG: hypothetical protein HOI47_30380, partial [Candidatus Scalindua sp.]|nr:hypothetical protein [Candidatus Scalindua sp.]